MEENHYPESILDNLGRRGWIFRKEFDVFSFIRSTIPNVNDDLSVDIIHSELLNTDLREIGGISLPGTSSSLKKTSHCQGLIILQVMSARDITKSSIEAATAFGASQNRLLRFCLTDGHSEVTAIEYSPIPAISSTVVPGTKVYLKGKCPIRNGILCLDANLIEVLGGVVQTLHQEWEMSQKYSGSMRSSFRTSQTVGNNGPPPFEKFQVNAPSLHLTFSEHVAAEVIPVGYSRQIFSKGNRGYKEVPVGVKAQDMPSSSVSRPKEVSEAMPVQNQTAAKKLLQKLTDSDDKRRVPRGARYSRKGRQQDEEVFTFDEWEKKKGVSPVDVSAVEGDEELARRLQSQFDIQDGYVEKNRGFDAEDIRAQMFNFRDRHTERGYTGRGYKGRGHGRRSSKARFT